MILAVMQPTYLPWLGYFDLIDQSHVFVFHDNVQFEKQSWQQRNRIKTSQGGQWLSVPVYQSSTQTIIEVSIVQIGTIADWRRKHWKSLATSYQKAPFWSTYGPVLEEVYQRKWEKLSELNIHLIHLFSRWLGLSSRVVRASELPSLPLARAERLVALCKMFEADVYLSPAGSRSYLESDELFQKNGISLVFQQYDHPEYPQLHGGFISHLSVLDLLMNCGPSALEIIRSGRKKWKKCSEMVVENGVMNAN